MKNSFIATLFISSIIFTQGLFAEDLKITNFEITPTPKGVNTPQIQLHMYRSYKVKVDVSKKAYGTPCFTVRTICMRGNQSYTLGEARIGFTSNGWRAYALYDIFPSSAGQGSCMLRTIIDADNEVAERDESALSNQWDRNTLILK